MDLKKYYEKDIIISDFDGKTFYGFVDDYIYPVKQSKGLTKHEKIMFFANLIMSIVITACTFIWGCL